MKPTFKDRIKKASKNVLPILKASTNRALKINKKEAKRRKKICDDCNHSIPDNALGGTMCDLCLCNISAKVYSDDHLCEIGKWEKP